jgi:hypothetical protein
LPHGLEQYMRDAGEVPVGEAPALPPEPPLLQPLPPIGNGAALPEFPPEQNPLVAAMAAAALPEPPPSHSPVAPRVAQPRVVRPAPKPRRPAATPDFSGLPPAMAESLAKLAGVPWPPRPEGTHDGREFEDQAAGGPPAKNREG